MATNMKAVKLRIKSVESTMQITKAMELVASSKLRKAKERSDNCRPYFERLYQTLCDIANENTDFTSIYSKENEVDKVCYIVLAGDRGLAGGYNSNLFKCLESDAERHDYMVLPIGKKAVEYCKRKNIEVLSDSFGSLGSMKVDDCFEIAKLICDLFADDEAFGRIKLVYTRFESMLSQVPRVLSLLPLPELISIDDKDEVSRRNIILYEPNAEEVFDAIIPEYLAGVIYGAVCDSLASEQAARRAAMESATSNAEEMISTLNLHYNRARQASITQEITEIVGGAEGI
ncbi:MAG: ATP synthase F1 subunit gamma [Clostridia bacterium]|nr:ATP synthase F1 subunit gamma [Clostridia bacterium]